MERNIRDMTRLGNISYGQIVDRTSQNMEISYGQDWLKNWGVQCKLTRVYRPSNAHLTQLPDILGGPKNVISDIDPMVELL